MGTLLRVARPRAFASFQIAGGRGRFALAVSRKGYSTYPKHDLPTGERKSEREEMVDFGFTKVAENEKAKLVGQVFHNVADKYDLMNDLMSAGVHRVWKDHFVSKLSPTPGTKILDVAGGTGDIAFRMVEYMESQVARGWGSVLSEPSVVVCDINTSMLEVGQKRAQDRGYPDALISWTAGDAERLPFPDNTFDAYTIAFGIRNVTHIDSAIREAHRVLKKGGRFMCLEFSKVHNPLVSSYVKNALCKAFLKPERKPERLYEN